MKEFLEVCMPRKRADFFIQRLVNQVLKPSKEYSTRKQLSNLASDIIHSHRHTNQRPITVLTLLMLCENDSHQSHDSNILRTA